MNKINAIIASLALSGVAAAGDQEMDVLDRVQIDAATRASLKPEWMSCDRDWETIIALILLIFFLLMF